MATTIRAGPAQAERRGADGRGALRHRPRSCKDIAQQVRRVVDLDAQVAVVIGGGNIWRGLAASSKGMDRATADYMGMVATVLNALALQDALEHAGVPTRVMTAIQMHEVAEPYIRRRAIRHMEKGRVVILAAGTGNPYFTTDTAAALRALELDCDILLMAKNRVEGSTRPIPRRDPDARLYHWVIASGSAGAQPAGHGRIGAGPLPGQRPADPGLQYVRPGRGRAAVKGRTGRHHGLDDGSARPRRTAKRPRRRVSFTRPRCKAANSGYPAPNVGKPA